MAKSINYAPNLQRGPYSDQSAPSVIQDDRPSTHRLQLALLVIGLGLTLAVSLTTGSRFSPDTFEVQATSDDQTDSRPVVTWEHRLRLTPR